MNTPHPSPLEGQPHTNRAQAAEPASPRADLGDPEGVAEGVPTAVRPDPRKADGRYPVAWLSISAAYRATPTATSTCLCGRDRRAFGERHVLALIADHADHRDTCPLRTPQEGRAAA